MPIDRGRDGARGPAGCTIAVLGPLRLRDVDGQVDAPTGRVARLLAWLALRPDHRTTLSAAARIIWTEGEGSPRHGDRELRAVIRAARQRVDRLEGVGLTLMGDTVGLVVPRHHLDADLFSDLVLGSGHDDVASLEHLAAALDLWRGDPYPELHDTLDALPEVERLRSLRAEASVRLNAVRLVGRPDHALVADLIALLTERPDDDRLWRQLAVALYRTGRRAAALRTLHACRRHFDRSGRAPMASVIELERALLDDDPALDDGDRVVSLVS